jgi:hypothetical protein
MALQPVCDILEVCHTHPYFTIPGFFGVPPTLMVVLLVPLFIYAVYLVCMFLGSMAHDSVGWYEESHGPWAIWWWLVAAFFVSIVYIVSAVFILISLGGAKTVADEYRDWWWRGRR